MILSRPRCLRQSTERTRYVDCLHFIGGQDTWNYIAIWVYLLHLAISFAISSSVVPKVNSYVPFSLRSFNSRQSFRPCALDGYSILKPMLRNAAIDLAVYGLIESSLIVFPWFWSRNVPSDVLLSICLPPLLDLFHFHIKSTAFGFDACPFLSHAVTVAAWLRPDEEGNGSNRSTEGEIGFPF